MSKRFRRLRPGKRRAGLKRWPSSIPLANGPVAFREYVQRTRKINTDGAIVEHNRHARLRQTDRRQWVDDFKFINLTNGRFIKVQLAFCGTVFFFRKVDKSTGMVQDSIEYGSHEQAMAAYDAPDGTPMGIRYKRPYALPETE